MKLAQDLRQGNVVKIGNDPYVILKAEYNKSGRNASVVKMKLRNLITKQGIENVFKAADKFEDIRLDQRQMQYLYASGDDYTFMDQESYDQIEISKDVLGDALNFLEEQMVIDVVLYEGSPVGVELPTSVERVIAYTEPGLRGDTSGKALKTAKLDSGYELQVPLFCEIGERIRIDTRTGEYVERVK